MKNNKWFIVKEKTYYIDLKKDENKVNKVIFNITLVLIIITAITGVLI